jgi:hypothetical protein
MYWLGRNLKICMKKLFSIMHFEIKLAKKKLLLNECQGLFFFQSNCDKVNFSLKRRELS